MKTDHPDLREIYQAYTSFRRPSGREKCPSPQIIARSFERSASVRKKKMIVDHISGCPMCREEFMMLLEHQEVSATDPIADLDSRPSHVERGKTHLALWQGVLALLGVTLVAFSFFFIRYQNADSNLRQMGTAGIILRSPKRNLSLSNPVMFRWQARPDSEYFILELFNESLLPVWASDKIRDLQVLLPPEVSSSLRSGQVYFWMVTSYVHDMKSGESPLLRFVVRR
jgi:hypothetical protein